MMNREKFNKVLNLKGEDMIKWSKLHSLITNNKMDENLDKKDKTSRKRLSLHFQDRAMSHARVDGLSFSAALPVERKVPDTRMGRKESKVLILRAINWKTGMQVSGRNC